MDFPKGGKVIPTRGGGKILGPGRPRGPGGVSPAEGDNTAPRDDGFDAGTDSSGLASDPGAARALNHATEAPQFDSDGGGGDSSESGSATPAPALPRPQRPRLVNERLDRRSLDTPSWRSPANTEAPGFNPEEYASPSTISTVVAPRPENVPQVVQKVAKNAAPAKPTFNPKNFRFVEDGPASTGLVTDGSELGMVNKGFVDKYKPKKIGITDLGTPEELEIELAKVGYQCMPFYAVQMSLVLNTPASMVRAMLLEGPPGCGKSFMAKSLAKITGAELMCLSCYEGMNLEHLIEHPSTLAMVNAMTGKGGGTAEDVMNLGILSRAYLKSQTQPVILLIDELDKVDSAIDTFFLGPIQDQKIWLESRPAIEANVDNLLILFTKNYERNINDALLRRVHPLRMKYMDGTLERKVLGPYCDPQLVDNLVRVADIMRYTDGSYPFDRPPAPEELLRAGRYIQQLLKWDLIDFSFVGKNVFYILSKSEHDRTVFEQLMRYHPDFQDPLVPDNRNSSQDVILARLGRMLLKGIVDDPDDKRRGKAFKPEKVGLRTFKDPQELVRRLSTVGYQCYDFLASQLTLLLSTESDRTRALLLEGPSGCGKSFMAKSLAKIAGADFMCVSCYADMNTSHLIEVPNSMAIAAAASGKEQTAKEKVMNLGPLSRAFLKSQNQPVILLIDELDKVGPHIDTFFLGPIQDARIWLESRAPIDANVDNLLVIFTKNFNRVIDDALLRRVHPIKMTYLDAELEKKVLSKYCLPQLVANLVSVADRMRHSGGSYQFERPPAPEELVTGAQYVVRLLEWGHSDFAHVGKSVWAILAKSEHDRAVLEHMMRFHPDFMDPLNMDGKNSPMDVIFASLGRVILHNIVDDPERERRERAWLEMDQF